MDRDPFAALSLAEIERRERIYRRQHPALWWVAEAVVFAGDPAAWMRGWKRRKAISYDGKPE